MPLKFTLIISFLFLLPLPARSAYRFRQPGNRYFYYIMGRYYLNVNNIELAMTYLEAARLLNPESRVIARELLEIYYIAGDYEKAYNIADGMYENGNREPDFLEIYADILINTERYTLASEIYEELLQIQPGNINAGFNLAVLHESGGEYESALKYYISVVGKDRSNLIARLSMASLYFRLGKTRAAVSHYLDSIKYGADPGEIYRLVARVYYESGRSKRALRYLQKAVEADSEDMFSFFMAAEIYQESGELEKAEEQLMQAAKIFQGDYSVLMQLGIFYADTEDLEKAEDAFRKLAELYPGDYSARHFLALIMKYGEKYTEARDELIKAVAIKETDNAYFHLGIVYDKLDMHEESYNAFLRCIELNPEHAPAQNYLGYIWAERGINLDEAKELILQALETEPDNAAYIDSLGWVYYQLERYEEALEQLKRAASKMEDPVIFEHLGDTYIKLGQSDDAAIYYRKAISSDPENEELIKKLESADK